MRTMKPLLSVLAIGAIGAGITACNPPNVTSSPGPAVTSSAGTVGVMTGPGRYVLQAMPAGTVTVGRGSHGTLTAHVVVFGLTPGSSHTVSVRAGDSRAVPISTLTADSTGQANVVLTSHQPVREDHDARLIIDLGTTADGSLGTEPIAETDHLSGDEHTVTLRPVSPYGEPAGTTTMTYNSGAQTLTITVTATGLTPGAHAAHVHLGSCRSQGAVKYMIPDFIADSNGAIADETRVVTGVTSFPGPGNWYLNLHMGGMNQILANGAPTLYFRPMLCTDITSLAMTNSASPSASASATATSSPSMSASSSASSMPSTMPSMPSSSASPSGSASATPSQSPTSYSTPTAYPTHW